MDSSNNYPNLRTPHLKLPTLFLSWLYLRKWRLYRTHTLVWQCYRARCRVHILEKFGSRVNSSCHRRTWSRFVGCVDSASAVDRRRVATGRETSPTDRGRCRRTELARPTFEPGRCCCKHPRSPSSSSAAPDAVVRSPATSWVGRSLRRRDMSGLYTALLAAAVRSCSAPRLA